MGKHVDIFLAEERNWVEIEILEYGGRWGRNPGISWPFPRGILSPASLPLPPELPANRSCVTLNLFLFRQPHPPGLAAGQPSPPFFPGGCGGWIQCI